MVGLWGCVSLTQPAPAGFGEGGDEVTLRDCVNTGLDPPLSRAPCKVTETWGMGEKTAGTEANEKFQLIQIRYQWPKQEKKSTVPFPPYDRKKSKWRQWFSPICLKEADANYNHLRMHYFTPIFYGKKWKIPQPGAPFWQSPVQAALAAVATKNSPGIKR